MSCYRSGGVHVVLTCQCCEWQEPGGGHLLRDAGAYLGRGASVHLGIGTCAREEVLLC
jgi:hypothetical protein